MVGVEQCQGGCTVQYQLELPGEVVAVLYARIGTAGTKGGHLVGRVAGKQHPAMAEGIHAAAGKLVHRYPLQLKLHIRAQHGLDARNDFLGFFLFGGVGVPAQLKVDAPDVVALLVQQHALAAVEGRIKPEPAFSGKVGLHHHVGNQKTVLKEVAGEVCPCHAAGVAVGAVGGDHPLRFHLEDAVGCFDCQGGDVIILFQTQQLVFPAQVHQRGGLAGFHQCFFQVVLLQVDHGRHLVLGLWQQVELVGQVVVEEHFAHLPLDAAVGKSLAHTQPVPDLQRALGVAHGP